MANIIINNYCNLQCPYCFTQVIQKDEPQNITLEEFQSILTFLQGQDRVGLLGGEPTLHPELMNILNLTYDYCKEFGCPGILFTNGLNLAPYLQWFADHNDRMSILINCNSPDFQSKDTYQKFQDTLNVIYKNDKYLNVVNLGCNIHPMCRDYSYLWEITDKHSVNNIRVSVVSPGNVFESWRSEKHLYFAKLKPIFMQFLYEAIEHGVYFNYDCCHIPKCFFSEDEWKLVLERGSFPTIDFCDPPVDILMGQKAIPCFGNYQLIDYTRFDNVLELKHYFLQKTNYDAALLNDDGVCIDCKSFKNLVCQGGCLAFSKINRTSS